MIIAIFLSANIWQCQSIDGHVTFTDHGCPAYQTRRPANQAPITPMSPLPPESLHRVEEIDRRTNAQLKSYKQERLQQRRTRERGRESKHTACQDAELALRGLLKKRRHGYALSDAASLDRRESELREQRRQSCR